VIGERSLRQLDEVLSRSPLALVAMDDAYRISYWSSVAQRLMGYEAAEIVGRHPRDMAWVHPDDMPEVLAFESRLGDEPLSALSIVARSKRKDGELRTFRWTTVAVQDDPLYHSIAFGEDITLALAAQAELGESEERFRSLFECNPDTVMFFTPDGKIAAVNAAVSHFGPLPRERIIGMHYSDFIDPEDLPAHEAYLRRALSGETISYRTHAHTYHGARLDLAVTTVPVTRNGRIEGVFSILRDETEQHIAHVQIERQERQLAESEARLRSLFLHNPDPVLALDLEGVMVDCNDAATRVSGIPREGIIGSNYAKFLPRATRSRVAVAFQTAASGTPSSLTFAIVNAEGRSIEVDGTIIPQYSQGRIVGIYAVFQDTTERRAAERRAEMQQGRIRDLYFIAASGDRPELRMRASLEMGARAFELDYGAVVDLSGLMPRVAETYRAPAMGRVSDERLIAAARAAIESVQPMPVSTPYGVGTRIDVAGKLYGALIFGSAGVAPEEFSKTDADLLGLIAALIAGAIETERSRAQLRSLAYYDTLTGLPNRAYLSEKVRDAIEVAQSRLSRAALLFIDLDGFKDVNDTLGHARGDRLLQLVSQRLSASIGTRDAVARMGGDEFVVLLPDCQSGETARELAERIIAVVSEPFMLDEYEHFISASIGIAMYPDDGRDDQTLIKNADIAMSRSKDRGRNGYFFYNQTLEGADSHAAVARQTFAPRARARRVRRFLSAAIRSAHRPHRKRRSPRAVESSQERSDSAVAVHSQRGNFGPDRAAGRVGARDGGTPGAAVAIVVRSAAAGRQSFRTSVSRPRSAQTHRRRARNRRPPARAVRSRDHGNGCDVGCGADGANRARPFEQRDSRRRRRFRNRLLIAGLSSALRPRRAENRRIVRRRHRSLGQRRDDRQHGHRHGPQLGSGSDRRGRRKPRSISVLARSRLRRRPRLRNRTGTVGIGTRIVRRRRARSRRRNRVWSVVVSALSPYTPALDRPALLAWYRRNRRRSAQIFDLIENDAFYARPIPLRHPFAFYEGHIPAFGFLTLNERALGETPLDPPLERLFERGIDPATVDAANDFAPADWPSRPEVAAFAHLCDERIEAALTHARLDDPAVPRLVRGQAAYTVLEHEPMHHETLLYLVHQLGGAQKKRVEQDQRDALRRPNHLQTVAAGIATLGADADEIPFGWDNEFGRSEVFVGEFGIQAYPVTNGDWLRFVNDGGPVPQFWIEDGDAWRLRGAFEELPLPSSWPVYVTQRQACAYASWAGMRLPTEAEYHRAVFGSPAGAERPFPWGDGAPQPAHGNFDFQRYDPEPVDAHPAGVSAWGVHDTIGNGWEWTATPFEPLPGFEPMASYPQYSADFFDGKHYVMKGASPVTARELIRRSFRNWFYDDYPFSYAKFRCASAR
jgi:iron(II)-dependent oxidoreductase